MVLTRKTLKTKSKKKNIYASNFLVRIIDTYEKDINKEISKISNKKCSNVLAGEILAQVIAREPNLLNKHKDIIKSYMRGNKRK